MTTAAECAKVSPTVLKHAAKNQDGVGSTLNSASAILAGIGAGVAQNATSSALYTAAAAACASAAQRAACNGNSDDAQQLRTAQMIFVNLAAGL